MNDLCPLGKILAAFDDEDRAVASKLSRFHLWRMLQAAQIPCNKDTVSFHYDQRCRCFGKGKMGAVAEALRMKAKRDGVCPFAKIYAALDEEDRAVVDTLGNTQCYRILKEMGFSISFTTVAAHRNKECRCLKSTSPDHNR